MKRNSILVTAIGLALASPLMAAQAGTSANANATDAGSGMANASANRGTNDRAFSGREDALQQVTEAREVIGKMKRDQDLSSAMARAKGILISPDYGRAGLGVGAHIGNGVLLVRNGDRWSGPALYNLGGISIGAQAGASAGQRALLLMTDKAVNQFKQDNRFSLGADAGITVVGWSAKAQARSNTDVIAWSDQGGLYAGASVAVNDVNFDERETAALYGRKVTPGEIIAGDVKAPQSITIAQAMP